MKTKINIAAILKDKPQGIKLYNWLYNTNVELDTISTTDEETVIWCTKKKDINTITHFSFSKLGTIRGCLDGLQILLPSREMRDWSKFTWKKGDILANGEGDYCVFKEFAHPSYQTIKAVFVKRNKESIHSDSCLLDTKDWHKASFSCTATYINTIEKELGGKLNRETLEVEKAQPEFKDGDIVTMHKKNCDIVFIFNRLRTEGSFYYYAFHALQTNNTGVIDCHTTLPCAWTFFEGKMNFATDSEKQQLFGALAKEGKAWDAKKKMLVDLKPKIEFKPFDKVLVRNTDTEEWFPGFFEKFDRTWNYPYHIMNLRSMTDFSFKQCIPYEGNEHLLGTTKDVEG